MELAEANARLRATAARQDRARAALSDGLGAVTDSATLYAVAAARSSARSMLTELDAVGAAHRAHAAQAQSAYNAARAQSMGLEKLETRHVDETTAEDVRGEQVALDEIAQAAWGRGVREGAL